MLKNDSSSNAKETTAGLETVSASLCAHVYDSDKDRREQTAQNNNEV